MSWSVADFEDAIAFDEGQDAQDPIFPPADGDGRGYEIVGERELMVEQAKKESQECFHCGNRHVDRRGSRAKK
jgi:hypothetical protein